jgi:catalase
MSDPEKEHIISAFSFELGKVKSKSVQQQVVDMFANVSTVLAKQVAQAIGATPPSGEDAPVTKSSPALSQEQTIKKPNTRKVAVIVANDFSGDLPQVLNSLKQQGIQPEIVSTTLQNVKGTDGSELEVQHTFLTSDSVLFDAVYVVGSSSADEKFRKEALTFAQEAFEHFKPIGATEEGVKWLEAAGLDSSPGVVTGETTRFTDEFIEAISAHRHWNRHVI